MKVLRNKPATTAAALGAAIGLLAAAAPSAHAAGSYNIRIDVRETAFVSDYCLLTDTSGNGRAHCSGNKGAFTSFRLGAVHNPGDRTWIDVNIVGGKDRKGIDLRGKHYLRISGNLAAVQVCGWSSLAAYDSGQAGASLHGTGFCPGG
ncbi:hypothetical protein ACFV7Q_11125 [Streptomyces sp. NPDC059851]|uniref:hypothetical protein n=1 Tax=Streptomyces sp. NPDC059851 TaxID=3346971 RepID=UPI00364A0690